MEIFVFGCGGHAKVVSEIIEAVGAWDIAGYVAPEPGGGRFLGREVLDEERFLETHRGAAVALAIGDGAGRRALRERLGSGFSYPSLVHPTAWISPSCSLGDGSVIMPAAVINAQAEIGRFCVVNSGAVVEHDCRLGDFVSVSPRACVCGACRLDEGCTVGAGATVIQGQQLGRWSLVGAGAVVRTRVEARSVVVGVPARPLRRV